MPGETYGIYIAGPMRGIWEFNFPAFLECEDYLWDVYEDVTPVIEQTPVIFCPARRDIDKYGIDVYHERQGNLSEIPWFDFTEALREDLDFLVNRCDKIVMLPGWEDSDGASHELATAQALGLQVDYYDPTAQWGSRLKQDPLFVPPLFVPQWDEDETALWAPPGPPPFHETRVVNESTGGEKGQKLARFDLIPSQPLWELAEHFGRGAEKYAERNWERGVHWSLNYAAMMRHMNLWWGGEDVDAETGSTHLACAGWHVLALMEYAHTHPDLDDRPRQHLAAITEASLDALQIDWSGPLTFDPWADPWEWPPSTPDPDPTEERTTVRPHPNRHDWTTESILVEKPDTSGNAARPISDPDVADYVAEEEERAARWKRHWEAEVERRDAWHRRNRT